MARVQMLLASSGELFQWWTREKVLGKTKSGCVLSAVQR